MFENGHGLRGVARRATAFRVNTLYDTDERKRIESRACGCRDSAIPALRGKISVSNRDRVHLSLDLASCITIWTLSPISELVPRNLQFNRTCHVGSLRFPLDRPNWLRSHEVHRYFSHLLMAQPRLRKIIWYGTPSDIF